MRLIRPGACPVARRIARARYRPDPSQDRKRGEAHVSITRRYLSRFHFDRVIRAAVGEAPATLRRRLLLEKAETLGDEVLDRPLMLGDADVREISERTVREPLHRLVNQRRPGRPR